MWVRKASESEPLMTCRNKSQWRRNRFRVRKVRTRRGNYFFGFNPAVSDVAAKRIRAQIRSWRLHLRSGWTLKDLAREINMTVREWISYYGRFYPSGLYPSLNRINDYLVRWIVQKYKRYRGKWKRAREALQKAAKLYPRLFRGRARGREIPRMITESPQPSAALDHRDQYRQSRRNAQVCGNSRYAESGAISCAQRAARSATRSTRRAGRSRPRATTSGVAAASAKAPAIRLVR